MNRYKATNCDAPSAKTPSILPPTTALLGVGEASMRDIVCSRRSRIVENAPYIAPNIKNIAVIDRA